MGRLAVMAHYDPQGLIGPHVKRHVEALAADYEAVTVVTTADLTTESRDWFNDRVRLLERANYGYDFFSFRHGLLATDLTPYDEVSVCNDSYIGPLVPYRELHERMAKEPVDFWGMTETGRVEHHTQSFFVTFRPWVVRSQAFNDFWSHMAPISDRLRVIREYEVGMSSRLYKAGFVSKPVYRETAADRKLGHRRMKWWATRRAPLPRGWSSWRAWQTRAAEYWNPSAAFADVALDDGRLPYVKIDTLRYDPYGLDSERLLDLLEQKFPDHFEGVRRWLADTSSFYAPRKDLQPKSFLRVVEPWVRYGNA